MKRFEKYLSRSLAEGFLKEDAKLENLGIEKRYVPDQIEIFDELEFGLGRWNESYLVFTVVLEHGKLGRISLGYIPSDGDEDDLMALTQDQLDSVLELHGQKLEQFLAGLFSCPES